MQRVKLSLACLLCVSWITAASAQSELESDSGVAALQDFSGGVSLVGGTYINIQHISGAGVGYTSGYTNVGGFVPYWLDEDTIIAPNGRIWFTNNNTVGGSIGGVFRRYFDGPDRIYGFNIFGDFDQTNTVRSYDYKQLGFGFESLGQFFDMRSNVYLPQTNNGNFVQAMSLGNTPYFAGNNINFVGVGQFQEALRGADVEVGAPVTPNTPWLRAYAGIYAYSATGSDPVGARGRLEAMVSNDLTIGVNVTEDNRFGTNVNAVVDFRFSGFQPTRYFPQLTTRDRMTIGVQRNGRIATAEFNRNVPIQAINPGTGLPYFVVWVDNDNPNPGNGTYENPYHDFQPSQPYPQADLILVRRGHSDVTPLNGPVQLFDNQRLLGEGREHSFAANAQFEQLVLNGTFLMPGFVNSGLYPTITAPGDIVTLANNNEVSAFNLINAGGAGIADNPVLGARDFNVNYVNMTNNQRGMFLQNASGIGVVSNVNALDNALGGISIANSAPLNLIMQDVTSNSTLPGTQAVGIELTATNAPLTVTMNNVTASNNAAGMRINGLNSDIVAIFNTVNVSQNAGPGLEAFIDGGSLAMAANSLNASANLQNNIDLQFTNAARMDLVFTFVDASASTNGNGISIFNNGGTGTAFLDVVNASGNGGSGFVFTGDNGANIAAGISGNALLTNNGQRAIDLGANNLSTVNVRAENVNATGSGTDGLAFTATGNSLMNLDFVNVQLDNSGLFSGGRGILGVNFDSTVNAVFNNVTANNNGGDGMFLVAVNGTDDIRVNGGSFANNGQFTANSAGINIFATNSSNVLLNVEAAPLNNDFSVPATQADGLRISSNFSSNITANLDGVDMTSNLDNAVDATVATNGAATINMVNSDGSFSGFSGLRIDAQSGGQLRVSADATPFNVSGANGIDAFVRTDADVTVDFRNGSDILFSGQNGVKVDIADAGSTFTGFFNDVNISESGVNGGGVNQQDAIHVVATDSAQVDMSLVNTTTNNFAFNFQQRGLFAQLQTGAVFNFNNTNGDMSANTMNAVALAIANPGSTANLNIQNTLMNNSGETGFLWFLSDSGTLNANINNSTLDSSGAGGVQGSGIFGVATTGGMANLTLTNTPVTNALDDAVRVVATDLGTTVNAVFNASPLDNAGQSALDLTFLNGAAGIFTLVNGSTGTNAGLDAVHMVADGVAGGVNTSLTVNAFDGDFSDSGQAAPSNGITALVSTNANAQLNLINTNVTNTAGTSPQLRGLFFTVLSGGNFNANFFNSDLSRHSLEGINGVVDGFNLTDSRAQINLDNTPVDGNVLNGAIFNVTNRGDLILFAQNGTTFQNNGATGIQADVDGALSTATFVLNDVTVDGNGVFVGGDGMQVTATNAAAFSILANNSTFSNNANRGIDLLTTTASTGFARFNTPTVNNNNEEALRVEANTASTLRTVVVGGSLSDNGIAGQFNNVTVLSTQSSIVETYFEGVAVDNSTLNGFSFDVNTGSILLAQMRNGVTSDNNANGSGLRFIARDALTQGVLYMEGANTFNDNGTAVTGTAINPQAGAGVFFDANGVDRAGIRFAGSASTNGNAGNLFADVDGDGDRDDDGVYINIRNTNLAAVELQGPGAVGSNQGDGVDIQLTNVTTIGQITQPSFITPPAVTLGGNGVQINNLTVSGNAGKGVSLIVNNANLPGPIVVNGNLIVQNTGGDGLLIDLTNVTGTPDITITNNQIGLNTDNGINLNLDNTPIDQLNIVGNSIGLTQGGAGFLGDTLPVIRAGFDTTTLARNDDQSSGLTPVGFNMNFFGTVFNSLFVNNNGNVTFNAPLFSFTPFPIVTNGIPIIAPFFADVDTRTNGNPTQYGNNTVAGRQAFGVTWDNVDYFSGNHGAQTNEFQLVIIDRSDVAPGDFDFEFNYEKVTWETGDASGGTNGLGGSSARVGFSNGSTNSLEFVGSAVNGAFLDSGPAATSLIQNSLNSVNLGRYRFASRGGAIGGTSPNGGDGIRINATNGSDIAATNINQNVIQDNGGHGVEILANNMNLGPVTLDNNSITGNGGDGVRLVSPITTNGTLDVFANTNTISNNGGTGLNLDLAAGGQSLNLQANSNTIEGNTSGPGINIALADNRNVVANFNANSINTNGAEGINFAPGLNGQITANFTNNTINGNASHGIDIPLQAGGRFTSNNFYGNTIGTAAARNGGMGVNLVVPNNAQFNWQLGDSAVAANNIGGNTDAGVGIRMTGNATGVLNVENSTFANTQAGGGNVFGGAGLAISQTDTSVLNNVTIGDAVAHNTNFNTNAGDGLQWHVGGNAQMTNPIIRNVSANGNTGDGANFLRTGNAVVDNVTINNSSFIGNADGLDIGSRFAMLVDEYTITNNTFNQNTQNGIRMNAQADARINTILTNNRLNLNGQDGLNISTVQVSPGDVAEVFSGLGAWTNNTFDGNGVNNGAGGAGIEISGVHTITLGTGAAGNLIRNNAGDGIEINAPGSLTINNAVITGNNTSGSADGLAGIDLNSAGGNTLIVLASRISNNLGDGMEIDITGAGTLVSINDSAIQFNGRDGVEWMDRGVGLNQLNVNGSATGANIISDNAFRGLDIVTAGFDPNSRVSIDQTDILRNGQEGVYVVLSSDAAQTSAGARDQLANVAMQANGAIGATPFLTFGLGNNRINQNGQVSGSLGGSGLVMQVGTTRGGDNFNVAGGFASAGNGGVVATVINNSQMTGNFGADVIFQSFTSTVNPATTAGSWSDQNTNPRDVPSDTFDTQNSFRSDPLARLDLVFQNNTGDELSVTRQGAEYNNAEAVFKSRTQNQDNATDGGADDDGPFGVGTRSRNAQRLAARNVDEFFNAGQKLNPDLTIFGASGNSDNFLFSGLGQSTFRVNQSGNSFAQTVGNGNFILDNFAGDPFGNNAIYDSFFEARGVIGNVSTFGGSTTGPFGIDTMPWGWATLP